MDNLKYRIWAEFVPNATPLAGRSGRYRVLHCWEVEYKPMPANRIYVDDGELAFLSARKIRKGAFVNPRRELGV